MGPPGKSGVDGLTVSLNFTVICSYDWRATFSWRLVTGIHSHGFISIRQESGIGYCRRSQLNIITTGYGLARKSRHFARSPDFWAGNEGTNSMTDDALLPRSRYSDCSAFHWLKQFFILAEALPRSEWWRVISIEFLRLFLRRRLARKREWCRLEMSAVFLG